MTLVSGRRPDLLRPTLASFQAGLFANFPIRKVLVNLDPVFGDLDAHAECVALVRQTFPDACVFEPEAASFGWAVKRTWAATESDMVIHLEDDWLLNEAVGPGDVAPLMTGQTRAVVLVSRELGWNGTDLFNVRRRRRSRIGRLFSGDSPFQVFGTSPRFLDGAFARRCSALMNPNLDPEKQMRPPGNAELIAFLQSYRCRFLPPKAGRELITDTGRVWREARGIEKLVHAGASTWRRRDD